MKNIKDLNYYKNNCEENYITTPISVLRYINELEQALQLHKTNVSNQCLHENTTHQKLTCNVCLDCHEIIETDV